MTIIIVTTVVLYHKKSELFSLVPLFSPYNLTLILLFLIVTSITILAIRFIEGWNMALGTLFGLLAIILIMELKDNDE